MPELPATSPSPLGDFAATSPKILVTASSLFLTMATASAVEDIVFSLRPRRTRVDKSLRTLADEAFAWTRSALAEALAFLEP